MIYLHSAVGQEINYFHFLKIQINEVSILGYEENLILNNSYKLYSLIVIIKIGFHSNVLDIDQRICILYHLKKFMFKTQKWVSFSCIILINCISIIIHEFIPNYSKITLK